MPFNGRSGLHLEVWLRIPFLTESFCEKLRFIQMNDPKETLLSIDFGVIRSQENSIMIGVHWPTLELNFKLQTRNKKLKKIQYHIKLRMKNKKGLVFVERESSLTL